MLFSAAADYNRVLFFALFWWGVVQFAKVPVYYLRYRRFKPGLWVSAGGMPSSHASLMCALTTGTALRDGMDSTAFAICFVVSMIVMYDAAGVRQAASIQARMINKMIDELFEGHPISEERLKELLGHTRVEVFVGALIGIFGTLLLW
ncbi:MAG: divergent PAP2 family protein [Thermoflexales bacterium]|nr:divergent PAP2 family protein [Thermoflexales bacterium]